MIRVGMGYEVYEMCVPSTTYIMYCSVFTCHRGNGFVGNHYVREMHSNRNIHVVQEYQNIRFCSARTYTVNFT